MTKLSTIPKLLLPMTKLFLQNSHDTILLSGDKLSNLTKLFEPLTALSSKIWCKLKDGGRGSWRSNQVLLCSRFSVRGNYTVPFKIPWKGDQREDPSQKATTLLFTNSGWFLQPVLQTYACTEGLWDRAYGLSSLSGKACKSNHFQMSTLSP